ncbi:MAG: sensor histidine kinase [Desulfobacterales bacterium]
MDSLTAVYQRNTMKNVLPTAGGELYDLSKELIKIQETERARIAEELHDQLGQDMAVLKFGIRNLIKQLPGEKNSEIRRGIKDILSLSDMIIEHIRSLARDLSPSVLRELGLKAALHQLVENFARFGGYRYTMDMGETEHIIEAEKHVLVYRIVQELLTNIAKHAGASRVDIQAFCMNGILRICVSDDGSGFDAGAVMPRPDRLDGLGMCIARQRADLLGGALEVDSSKKNGTTVTISIPVKMKGKM